MLPVYESFTTLCRGDFLVMDYDYSVYERVLRECNEDGGAQPPPPPPSDTGYSRECNTSPETEKDGDVTLKLERPFCLEEEGKLSIRRRPRRS